MKKLLLALSIMAGGFASSAQELAHDQNPNYKLSQEKYQASHTSLQTNMNTTLQQTYAAYDWRTSKALKKAERRADRREDRLFNNYNERYNDPYGYNGRNNYGRPNQYRSYHGWRW